ncbi:NTP transferase domain-containing protein [Gordonia sp. (in: high G+C Gram-positive bacteria)]|uniref:NTP transferase domain-containing protein n=1 Tax=Gordonia sp. (in: high G+C Gram-positive bacteria) TaxID=84139 RepID=UPI00352887EC
MTSSGGSFDAIVLAGGRARRLAGADKPAELVGGRRLLDIALDAVAGAGRIVVVGPDRPLPPGVLVTREDPPYSGPVAAVAAGTAALEATDDAGSAYDRPVVLVASDLPEITAAQIDDLRAELERSRVPVVLAADAGGHPQYLLGVWRRAALAPLRHAPADSSMRSLIPGNAVFLPVSGTGDVDTPADLATARRAATPRGLEPAAARAVLLDRLAPLPPVVLPLDDAAGAVLADPLVAAAAFPPFDAAAMDGYAVAGRSPWRLVDAPRAAGHLDTPPLQSGCAAPIATGAALPPGAERVVRHEEVTLAGGVLTETSTGRDDTRRTGSAWPRGATLAAAGTAADAAVRSVARAAGVERLTVRGPLAARLHTSGDEVIPAGGRPRAGSIPDTASGPVADVLTGAGVRVTAGGHLDDRPGVFAQAVAEPNADLVVIIGATGHGIADHLRTALATAGARILLDGLSLRPGGSLIAAQIPSGTVILGLGGNPLAAVAGIAVLLPALLDALLGRRPAHPDILVLDDDTRAHRLPGRWRVLPVEPDGRGRWTVTTGHGTGHLASMIGHRGLALVPPEGSSAGVERLR